MELLFLNDIILILPGNDKQRFVHGNTAYFKDTFMLGTNKTVPIPVLHQRQPLMNSSRLTFFFFNIIFISQNSLSGYLKV